MHKVENPRSHYKTYGRRRSLRLPGFDYGEPRAYHLTWGTHERRPLLRSRDLASAVVHHLVAETDRSKASLYAYCVMPDHVHVLLMPFEGASVISFVQSVKSRTTRDFWNISGRRKLWQRGFHDHILRNDEDVERIGAYILANPVRAGLVDEVAAYPFSGPPSLLHGPL
jgi:putative transposase